MQLNLTKTTLFDFKKPGKSEIIIIADTSALQAKLKSLI